MEWSIRNLIGYKYKDAYNIGGENKLPPESEAGTQGESVGETLQDRLKRAREEAGLNQESLAKLAGVTQSAYSQLESGKTKKGKNLPEIAQALGVSVDWLMHGGDPSKRFTAGQKQAQQNLRAIWQAKKKQLDLTQEKAAHLMGWNSQGSVTSYLDGRIPLNTDAVLKFAELLNVPPEKIDTEFPYGVMANPPSKPVEDWPAAREEADIPRHVRELFDAVLERVRDGSLTKEHTAVLKSSLELMTKGKN